MPTKFASRIVEGDLVEMRPVYQAFGHTETTDYIVSESEFGLVSEVEFEGPVTVVLHFENLGAFALPFDYVVEVPSDEPDVGIL